MTPEQEFNQCIKEVAEFIKEIDKMLLEAEVLGGVVAYQGCSPKANCFGVKWLETAYLKQKLNVQALSFYFPDFILWGQN